MHVRKTIYRKFRCVFFGAFILVATVWTFSSNKVDRDSRDEIFAGRHLLSVNDTNSTDKPMSTLGCVDGEPSDYPTDIFTCDQKRKGAILLHCLGLVYMFVALAIVCDEFFVPSLSVIIEKLDISEDVAGATFMAAGGSAPELATSFIGTFSAENPVGIGTIVGSAVFNILFVIAMCTFFSKSALYLTWWPLARDIIFYSISLICLIIFFRNNLIDWWESLILLICYLLYVVFMKFNAQAEMWVKSKINKTERTTNNGTTNGFIENGHNGAAQLAVTTSSGSPATGSQHGNVNPIAQRRASRRASIPVLHSGSGRFRSSVFQLMLHTIDPITEGFSKYYLFEDFQTICYTMTGDEFTGDPQEKAERFRKVVQTVQYLKGPDNSESITQTNIDNQDTNGAQKTEHNISSTVPGSCDHLNSQTQTTKLGSLGSIEEEEEVGTGTTAAPSPAIPSKSGACGDAKDKADSSNNNCTTKSNDASQEPINSPDSALSDDVEEEEETPLSLSWPSTCLQRLIYIIIFPIVILLYITLPDVRNPARRKFFVWTFIGSIAWIAGFSYLMAWWANSISQMVQVPDEILGLTVLAAGTSIPDLLTSVIVAKKGFGDMAVSSSVGSNIFDITVGLPLPWIIKSAVKIGAPVSVSSKGMFCSILLLFGMLMCVVISIIAFKWKMTKGLGGAMIMLYFVFVTIAVLMGMDVVPCVFS